MQNGEKRLYLEVENPTLQKYILIRFIIEIGKAHFYCDFDNAHVSPDNKKESFPIYEDRKNKSLTKERRLVVHAPRGKTKFNLNIYIQAQKYTVFEMSSSLVNTKNPDIAEYVENIEENQLYQRTITLRNHLKVD